MKSTILLGMIPFSGVAPNSVIHLVLGYKAGFPNALRGQCFYPHFGSIIFGAMHQTVGGYAFEA
ncbi:MAG: hypothetical protein ACOYJ2_07220 [Rickettsiales bacterium]